MTPAISLTGLSRRYRDQLALDDVNLQIDGPSITGVLGRNGAGKTTLLRIIAAQEFASSGRVAVLGADPVENETILSRIAFVREDTVVLSTHLIDEASGLLERVVMLDRGRIVLDAGPDEVRGAFTRVSGAVDALVVAPWALLAFTFAINLIGTVVQGGPNPTKAVASIFAFMVFAGGLTMIRSLAFALALGACRRSFYLGTVALVVALAAVYGLVFVFGQLILALTGVFIISGEHAWRRVGHFFTTLTAAGLTGALAALAALLCVGGFALMRGVTV
jgi:ABC transporter